MTTPPARSLPITVAIQTKNEASSIVECVGSLTDFSEVIVVDSNSTDQTKELAQQSGATVVNFSWSGGYPKKKQWILESVDAKNDWLLLLDADERVPPQLIQELHEITWDLEHNVYAAYEIGLDYVFGGRVLRHGHRVVKTCLINRKHTRYLPVDDLGCAAMGELEGHYQPAVDGAVGHLRAKIRHHDPDPVSSWISRHNRYSDWEAYLRANPDTGSAANQLRSRQGRLFAKAPAKPLLFFLYDYIVKRGFMDGRAGFDYAFALTWYYWLTETKVREAKRVSETNKPGPPRVLQIVNTLSVRDGGPALAAADLHHYLNRFHAARSRLVSLQDHDGAQVTDVLRDLAKYDGTIFRIDTHLNNCRAFVPTMRMEVAQADAVIIHGYYLWWVPLVARMAQRRSIPFIVVPHGCLTARQQRFSRGKKLIFDATVGRYARNRVDTFVTATPNELEEFAAKFPTTPATVARLGVAKPGDTNVSFEGPHTPLRLLSMSRIAPKKRIDLMFKCTAELANRGIDCQLIVAGDTEDSALANRLNDLLDVLMIRDRVTFAGQVTGQDKERLYRSSDILLLPSEDENFGLAPIEALMCGCPVVVSSKVSSTITLAGEACAVIPDPSGPAMADKIVEWLESPSPTFEQRRASGVASAEAAYSWASVMNDWRRVLALVS